MSGREHLGWMAAALAALWAPVAWRLAPAWRADPELVHGWAVPILALYLAWDRRATAPRPEAPGAKEAAAWTVLALLGGLGVAASLPVLEANPSWPTAGWAAVLAGCVATCALLARRGGWRRASAFAGPVLFALAALPWPTALRAPLTLGLADLNAVVAAELISAAGWPAVVKGRVIEVGAGLVGVDEACSGVRSLQTVAMTAAFFVLLFRLRGRRAAGLVAASVGVALAVNLGRTCWLTWRAATEGISAMDASHDAAGEFGLVLTLALVGLIAWGFEQAPGAVAPSVPERGTAGEGAWATRGLAALAAGVFGLMVAAEAGTRAWYARGEAARAGSALELEGGPEARVIDPPAAAQKLLGYSRGSGLHLEQPDQGRRSLWFLFSWEAEAATTGGAFLHDPTVCLPSIGSALEADLGPVAVDVHGVQIELQAWRFRAGERTQHVFFALWDGHAGRTLGRDASMGNPTEYRWRQVREARRRSGLHQIIVAIEGAGSEAEAIAELRALAPRMLRRGGA